MQTAIRLILSLTLALSSLVVVAAELYFPDDSGDWETVSPESVGWNSELIDAALDLAGERNSSGVLILHRAVSWQNNIGIFPSLIHVTKDTCKGSMLMAGR